MRNLRLILCIYPPIWPFQLFTPLNIGQGRANCAMIENKPASGVLTQHPLPPSTVPPAIIIHGIEDLRAALEAAASLNRALTVLSIPGAAGSAGAPWFHALIQAGSAEFPKSHSPACWTAPTSRGTPWRHSAPAAAIFCCSNSVPAWPRVHAIAEASGARLHGSPGPTFNPRFFRDPIGACREWLAVNP